MKNQNWPIVTDASGHFQQTEKRLGMEERRPRINKASDLLGPLAGPSAVLLNDTLNSDKLAFNGLFIVPPGAPESPDPAVWWIGQSIAQDGIGGVQVLWTFRLGDAPHREMMRGWETLPGTGGLRVYSPWQSLAPQRIEFGTDSGIITIGDAYAEVVVTWPNGAFPGVPIPLASVFDASPAHTYGAFFVPGTITTTQGTVRLMRYEGASTAADRTVAFTYTVGMPT